MENEAKFRWPLYTGKRVPSTYWKNGSYPRTPEDFADWASVLIEWSEDPCNLRLPSFATHLRFTWQRMYEWVDRDPSGVWGEALKVAKDNIGRHRERMVGVEGGIHQTVYARTSMVFDDYVYDHHVKDRRLQAEETARASGTGGAVIKVVLPDLCGNQ